MPLTALGHRRSCEGGRDEDIPSTPVGCGSVSCTQPGLGEDVEHGGTSSAQSVPAFVGAVEQFCRLDLARPIGVEDMARVAKMSRFYFSRQFGKVRGIGPGRYLARLRIDEAMRLIASSEFSLEKIAELCGFGDGNYLCKVFRKNYGVSPGTFRALGIKSASLHSPPADSPPAGPRRPFEAPLRRFGA